MWLLNATTLRLEWFFEESAPPYAILSHTWVEGQEVSLQEIQQDNRPAHKSGYQKIEWTCQQALRDGLTHAWVDTCCIDKTSSAELSEAINSMFRWYEKSCVCYAYLADVFVFTPDGGDFREIEATFSESRWFTRGWTLQELIAPETLKFYASGWYFIAEREQLKETIGEITKIDTLFLDSRARRHTGCRLGDASIAERMNWAAGRKTTRTEDVAYCLLGIFGISMPLLYGEGESAFRRLQEEIIRHSDDQSIFAWAGPTSTPNDSASSSAAIMGILATSPAAFAQSANIAPRSISAIASSPFSVTNKGIRISLPVSYTDDSTFAILLCGPKEDPTKLTLMPLSPIEGDRYARSLQALRTAPHTALTRFVARDIYLASETASVAHGRGCGDGSRWVWVRSIPPEFEFQGGHDGHDWSNDTRTMQKPINLDDSKLPTFSLRWREGTGYLERLATGKCGRVVCIGASLEKRARNTTILTKLGINPLRICLEILADIQLNSTSSAASKADAWARKLAPQHQRHGQTIRATKDTALRAAVTQIDVLGKQFVVVDVERVDARWVLAFIGFMDVCGECLFGAIDSALTALLLGLKLLEPSQPIRAAGRATLLGQERWLWRVLKECLLVILLSNTLPFAEAAEGIAHIIMCLSLPHIREDITVTVSFLLGARLALGGRGLRLSNLALALSFLPTSLAVLSSLVSHPWLDVLFGLGTIVRSISWAHTLWFYVQYSDTGDRGIMTPNHSIRLVVVQMLWWYLRIWKS